MVTEIIPPEPCAEEKFIIVNGGVIFNHNPLEIRLRMFKISFVVNGSGELIDGMTPPRRL